MIPKFWKKFSPESKDYPSHHTIWVVGATFILYLSEGPGSILFLSMMLSCIVMYDSVKWRKAHTMGDVILSIPVGVIIGFVCYVLYGGFGLLW